MVTMIAVATIIAIRMSHSRTWVYGTAVPRQMAAL